MKPYTLFFLLVIGQLTWPLELRSQGESTETWVDYPKNEDGTAGIDHPFIEERGLVKATRRQPFSLALADPPQGATRYSASGLPPGLSISETSGEITGTPLLSGLMEVVIQAERVDEPTAFFRFQLDCAPNVTPGRPQTSDIALPQGPILRVQSLPKIGNPSQSVFPVNFLSLTSELPSGLVWNSTREDITGVATAQGVTALTYTSAWGDSEIEGQLVISAGDYTSAAPMRGAAGEIALLGNVALGLTNDIRPMVRAQLPEEWSTEPIIGLGVTPPWPDESNLNTSRRPILARYRDERFAYLTRSGMLYTSLNGIQWTAHLDAFPPLPNDPDRNYRGASLFVSDSGAVVVGRDGSTGRSVTGVTSDWNEWHHVDTLENGGLDGIIGVCHNGTEWIAFTSSNGVHRSNNGGAWNLVGYPVNEPPNLSQHVFHDGRFYAISKPSQTSRSQIYYSDDTLTWHLLPHSPDESIQKLLTADRTLFCLTTSGVYQWNEANSKFDLLWMAPPSTSLADADYADGKLLVSTGHQTWLIHPSELTPQLQGPRAFPNLDDIVATAGEPILYPLHSNDQNASFKAYQLPEGVSLDPITGELSGVLNSIGIHDAIVSAENEIGEGVPRRLRFYVHSVDAPHNRISASFGVFHEEPTHTYPYVLERDDASVSLYLENIGEDVQVIAVNLPRGLHFDSETRMLSGRAYETGYYDVLFYLFSAEGSETATAPLLIYKQMAHVGMQNYQFEKELNSPILIQQDADGPPLTYIPYDLPNGLDFDPLTGDITGTIAVPGRYYVLLGRITEQGVHAQPRVIRLDVRADQIPPQSLPDLQAGFTEVPSWTTSYEISFEDVAPDADLAFISLPNGVTFVPPRTLEFHRGLTVGMHSAQARISNSAGFIDVNWWIIRENPSETQTDIRLESGDTFRTCLGCSVAVEVETELEEGNLVIANLPPGLSLNKETRIISGTPEAIGDFTVKLMFVNDGRSLAYDDVTFFVRETIEDKRLSAKQSYFTGLLNEYVSWNPHLYMNSEDHDQIVSTQVPPGISISPPYMGGRPTRLGEESVRFTFTDGITHEWPTMIYTPPVWENARPRVRLLPSPNAFQLDQLVVMESYTTFASPVRFYSNSVGSQNWNQHSLPQNAPYPSFTDIIATSDGYLMSGGDLSDGGWIATAASLGGLTDAQGYYKTPSSLAYHQGLRVATTHSGDILFSEDNSLDRSWNLTHQRSFHSLAHGNGRFVAVGDAGAIHIMTLDINQQPVVSPVSSDLKDIIFSEGEFYAVGSAGTVIKSTNGTDWTIDRFPRSLGAEFRYVTANADIVAAVSPYTILGKRRADSAAGWEPMVRVPVEGSMVDDLEWADGHSAGGLHTGLYVPRSPTASTTVLSAPFQSALAGETFSYHIAATGDNPSFRVDALPEGLEFDASSGAIRGVFAEAGIYQMLIEATASGKTHGKTLTIHCWGGAPRILQPTIEIPSASIIDGPQILQVDPPFESFTREETKGSSLVLSAESRIFPGNSELSRYLTLTAFLQTVLYSDSHTARVHLSNPVGETTETITLRLISPKPSFPGQPQSVAAKIGDRVELSTKLQGRLPIALKWFFGDEPVNDGDGYSGTTSEHLVIKSLTSGQFGSYYLVATNELGTTNSSIALVQESGFAAWAAGHGIDPTNWLDDHDGDGWSNLLQYALSISPDSDLDAHFPILDGHTIKYIRAQGREDIDYTLQHSYNMNEWGPVDTEDIHVESSASDLEEVRFQLDHNSPVGFYRLLVSPRP